MALSSGVDSAVAAALLRERHPAEHIHPIYLANWSPDQNPSPPSAAPRRGPYGKCIPAAAATATSSGAETGTKCIDREFNRVTQICRHLDLRPPTLLRLEKEYWHDVFAPMLAAYACGLTPNPDVACNRFVKFGALADRLDALFSGAGSGGAAADDGRAGGRRRWWLATGHYARVSPDGAALMRSADAAKDQTYFLATIPARMLARCIFPLGDAALTKCQVVARAAALQVPGWRPGEHTPESFGLCFVEPAGGFRRFLDDFLPAQPGCIVVGRERRQWPSGTEVAMPPAGTDVGTHGGLWHATVGEKARLQLPQAEPAFCGRWYVSRKYVDRNAIEVVKGPNNYALFTTAMVVGEWRWLGPDAPRLLFSPARLLVQFRHMQRPLPVERVDVRGGGDQVYIAFDAPQKAVACGQSAALWAGERCLGGGVIEATVGLDDPLPRGLDGAETPGPAS